MTIKCPRCGGRKGGVAFVNRGPENGCGAEWVECFICDGTGSVDEVKKAAWDLGREMFNTRLALAITLREAAQVLGVEPVKIFAIEHGREPPPDGWGETLRRFAAKKVGGP